MKILKFYSPTCGPCKVLDKNLIEAGINYQSISVVDGGIVEELKNSTIDPVLHYNIRTVPTIIKIDDSGNELSRKVGILTVEQLKNFYND